MCRFVETLQFILFHRKPKEKEILPRRASLRLRRMDPEGQQLPDPPEVKPLYEEDVHVCNVRISLKFYTSH